MSRVTLLGVALLVACTQPIPARPAMGDYFSIGEFFVGTSYPEPGKPQFYAFRQGSIPDIEIDPRAGQWPVGLDEMLELSKWFVRNCPIDHLGKIAGIIERAENTMFYTAYGAAFDGTSIALGASISADNTTYWPVSIVAGPQGIYLVRAGYNGVWAKGPGEFWFFGPNIHPVSVLPSAK